jgi:hypothetical protein
VFGKYFNDEIFDKAMKNQDRWGAGSEFFNINI